MSTGGETIQPYDPEIMEALYVVANDRDTAEFDDILRQRNEAMGGIPPAPPDITEYVETRAKRLTQPPTQGEQ